MAGPTPTPEPLVRLGRRYALSLAASLLAWLGVVSALVYLLFARSGWLQQADQAHLREWLDESRVFRKTLPDLVGEYAALRESGLPGEEQDVVVKAEEISEQLQALADPTRLYQGFLPLFPEIYLLEIRFPGTDWTPIRWESPVPRPRRQNELGTDVLDYAISRGGPRLAMMRCEYRLHAFNQRQREAVDRQQQQLFATVLGVLGILPMAYLTYWSLQRERRRELGRLLAEQHAEHARNERLQETLARQEAERVREELDRKLLEKSLESAQQENRASTAERAALELKSQLYASIGIMAGSYAHNIKNLLVRPNDLIARCMEAKGLSPSHEVMLTEVRETLGTVTERLQQILRTVRRDPGQRELTRIDLNELVRDMLRTWAELASDKWKLTLTASLATGPLWIEGDHSHLQQAIENLLFNARDATFEMRNRHRDDARKAVGSTEAERKRALIDAASWRGKVSLTTQADRSTVTLKVQDNGIGMTPEVVARCTETHFSTKRDNALYEGYNAGMGLGLSFTAVILEHHQGSLKIESQPLGGTTFQIQFPRANEST